MQFSLQNITLNLDLMLVNCKRAAKSFLPIYKIYQPPVKKISKDLDLFTQYKSGMIRRPLTFDEKCIIINDPKMISHLELVEYGMTFKPTKRLPIGILIVAGLIITYLYKNTPHPISERYFSISQQSQQYKFGYFGSMLSFDSLGKWVVYLPAFLSVFIASRYLKGVDFMVLMGLGLIGNCLLGRQEVVKKLQSYQVWDRCKITTGQNLILSIISCLLSFKSKSIIEMFTDPRLRLFFQALPGFGVTSKGIAVVVPFLMYLGYQLYLGYREEKPMSLTIYYILSGCLYGLGKRWIFKW